jgi:5-methylcytosine-specific restriction enzyme A
MSLKDDLHKEMVDVYYRAAEETGYRGTRYLQAVRRNGGLATAQRMLKPRTKAQRAGLDRILEAGKPELTMEAIVLEQRFRRLFTQVEVEEAAARLGWFLEESKRVRRGKDRLYPDELESGRTYTEGAKRQVRVNAYERDARARKACIDHHGCRCAVCELVFEERYGKLGSGFIHVHHLRPLAQKGQPDAVDPKSDLIPVCPNCHAMLHRTDPPLTVKKLRQRLQRAGRTSR